MTEPLTFTGERFLPDLQGEISYEHWHRYALAAQLGPGCTVLDIACGEGYGSALMAQLANRVIGVDISSDAVEHARSQYQDQENLEFIQGSCDSIPLPDRSIDLAVSFETIEHIETQEQFVLELRRVLKPDGLLIMSSPNKRVYSDAHDYHNEFHVRELYREEFEAVLKDQFPCINWFGQKLMFHSAIWPESSDFQALDYFLKTGDRVQPVRHPAMEAMYFLAICSAEASALTPIENSFSLFSESSESVYKDYANQTRRVLHLDELLGNRDRLIIERDELLETRTLQMEERERLIEERDELLTLRTQQMQERDVMLAELRQQLEASNAELANRDRQLGEQLTRLSDSETKLEDSETKLEDSQTQLAELRHSARKLDEHLADLQLQVTSLESDLANKAEQVRQQDGHLAARKQQVDELETELSKRADWLAVLDQQILELNAQLKKQAEDLDLRQQQSDSQLSENLQQRKLIESLKSQLIYRESLDWWLKLPWRWIFGRHSGSE